MKILSAILLILFFSCGAQQTEAFKNHLKYNIENKKTEYIGKPVNYVLSQIQFPVKSYITSSFTDKVEHITLYFISIKEVRNRRGKSPILLRIYFAEEQDFNIIKEMLKRNQLTWTQEEEKFFGNLIVGDIYVGGNL